MGFEIRYSLENDDIRNLELISQVDGYLQVLRMNPEWASLLESKARVREAIGSIGIEGTVLTIDQANAITVGDESVRVGEKEKREFVAYFDSLSYIKKQLEDELTIGPLLKIHEMVTRGDKNANPGKLRTDLRSVKRNGVIIYTAPPPDHVGFLLKEFFVWFNKVAKDKCLSPVVSAAICHFWFVWIHPFADGNGRVARLLTTYLLLKKKSEGIRYFALSDYYNKNLDVYYDALQTTNICDPKVPSMNFNTLMNCWIKFFVSSYHDQIKTTKEVTNRILQLNIRVTHLRKEGLITDGHERVLSFLSGREKASYKELSQYLGGVSMARITQLLKPLRDARILVDEKIGKQKWFKLGAPENEPDETTLKKKLKRKSVRRLSKSRAIQGVLPIFND